MFTHAQTHQRTWLVTIGVLCLHALALSSLLLHTDSAYQDNQKSIAMEMVLASLPNTTHPSAPKVTRTDPSPTAKAAQPQAPAVPTNTTAQTPTAKAEVEAEAEATPAAAPVQTGRTPGAAALTLPSSEAHGLNNPQPAYPRQSRRLNEQGQVVIRVFVTTDGLPQQGEIKTSSGFDRLDQEALRTVMRWRFATGQRFGVPEAMWFNVPVNFVLE